LVTPQPERFALDTNVFDRIVEADESLERVQRLVAAGLIEIVVTHVQDDELAEIPDEGKRERIARVPRVQEPTSEFIVGYSRIGMARIGTGASLEPLRAGNWNKYTKDALIAATAAWDGVTLVSEERRLRNRVREELGLDPWDWARLDTRLRALDSAV
jgi:predicted nucleic acid-binding protein